MYSRTLCVLCLFLAGCGPRPAANQGPARTAASRMTMPEGTLVDLTHPFDDKTIFWPTERGFEFQSGKNGVTEKGYYYAANRFAMAEHGGTHIDAPIHFYEGKPTVDQIELARLVGEGVVIDVSDKCEADRDYQITVGDLEAWEQKHNRQLVDVIVLLRTGWSSRWPDRGKFLGTNSRGPEAVAKLHFPGLDPLAAKWLVEHRAPKAVGIDTASIDYGQSSLFESHVSLFRREVPAFENVAALDKLPPTGAYIMALPMKISGGSGGPLRIVALLPDSP